MKEKRNAIIAWVFFALILMGVMLTFFLRATLLHEYDTGIELATTSAWGMVPILFAFVGALIISRQPRNVIGLLLMLPALTFAIPTDTYLASFSEAPATLSTFLWFVIWFNNWGWVLLIFPILFVLVLFPTGQPPSPRWRVLIYIGVGMMLTMVILSTIGEVVGPMDESWQTQNPIGFVTTNWVENYLLPVWFILLPVLTLASAAALFVRFRRTKGVEREQIKWLFFASGLFAAVYVPSFFTGSYTTANNIWDILFTFGIMAIPIAIAIAILRYRLYDIDIIIRRTIQYAILTGLLALVYFGSVILLQSLVENLTGTQSPIVIVVSTLAIAALFTPLRSRVQDFIDRRFYRAKYNAAQTLEQFAATARDEVDMEKLTTALLGVVDETMQPEMASLWLKEK
ncbi:MAG: hypothetical protein HQ525_08660 [Anaerolineae bacterium]|nr:hypothetical protein [Anaerolineae bacterium]